MKLETWAKKRPATLIQAESTERAQRVEVLPELCANLNRSITFPLEIKTSLGHEYRKRKQMVSEARV